MAKKAKPVEFFACVCQVKFVPSEDMVSVHKSHYSVEGDILSESCIEIPLTTNTFETAMQIASAIVSNVGLIRYEEC